jgi:uncharacterized membrane protein YcaP (DUF421 family)
MYLFVSCIEEQKHTTQSEQSQNLEQKHTTQSEQSQNLEEQKYTTLSEQFQNQISKS